MSKKLLIGCQGWNYKDWISTSEQVFYPRGTAPKQMLSYYAEAFDSIEVDSTFYAIPARSTVKSWYCKTPANFRFALKMPKEITHEKFLDKTSSETLEKFFDAISALNEKLLAVLIQLPPQFKANQQNAQKLHEFLCYLPKQIRFAIEFRRSEWLVDWTFEQLRNAHVSFCFVEGEWIDRQKMFQAIERIEDEFAYVRFMGRRDLTSFSRVIRPQDENLKLWRENLDRLRANTVFVSFSNFYEGFAPASANKMRQLYGLEARLPIDQQASLF